MRRRGRFWARIAKEVASLIEMRARSRLKRFRQRLKVHFRNAPISHIPTEFLEKVEAKEAVDLTKGETPDAIALASLLGSWNDKSKGDLEIIKRLVE